MDVSRRGLFAFVAGAGAGVIAGTVRPADAAQPLSVSPFPMEGQETARVCWFNEQRGFGYLEGLSSFHRIKLTRDVMERGGMEGVRPGQTLIVHWKIHRAADWTSRIAHGETPALPLGTRGEYGCIAYEALPTEAQQGTCLATVIWYQRVREFGFLQERDGAPHIFVRKRLFDAAGIADPAKGQTLWVHWKHTDKGRTAFEVRTV
jgi:cold shock CspA family protein